MSESGGLGGGSAASAGTVAAGAVVLPFTGGHAIVSYVVLAAMICASLVLISKLVKIVASRVI